MHAIDNSKNRFDLANTLLQSVNNSSKSNKALKSYEEKNGLGPVDGVKPVNTNLLTESFSSLKSLGVGVTVSEEGYAFKNESKSNSKVSSLGVLKKIDHNSLNFKAVDDIKAFQFISSSLQSSLNEFNASMTAMAEKYISTNGIVDEDARADVRAKFSKLGFALSKSSVVAPHVDAANKLGEGVGMKLINSPYMMASEYFSSSFSVTA